MGRERKKIDASDRDTRQLTNHVYKIFPVGSTDNKMMRCMVDNSEDMLVIYRTSAPQIYDEKWDQPVIKVIKMQW